MRSFLILLIVLLQSCVSPSVVNPVSGGVNFRQYETVSVLVRDSIESQYSNESMEMFRGLLEGKLRALGYETVPTKGQFSIDVTLNEANPANTSLRLLIGFGAGRALLEYSAIFRNANGILLGSFDGGKSYTGMELVDNPLFKGRNREQFGMISEAVEQISQYVRSNGSAFNSR